jgi:hypothetical protein
MCVSSPAMMTPTLSSSSEGEADDLVAPRVLELEHLLVHCVLQTVDARYAVPDLQNLPDLLGTDPVFVVRYRALEYGGDLLRPEPTH